jgi:hypothetical protein
MNDESKTNGESKIDESKIEPIPIKTQFRYFRQLVRHLIVEISVDLSRTCADNSKDFTGIGMPSDEYIAALYFFVFASPLSQNAAKRFEYASGAIATFVTKHAKGNFDDDEFNESLESRHMAIDGLLNLVRNSAAGPANAKKEFEESTDFMDEDRLLVSLMYHSGLVTAEVPNFNIFDLLDIDELALADYNQLVQFAKDITTPRKRQRLEPYENFLKFLKQFAEDRKVEADVIKEMDDKMHTESAPVASPRGSQSMATAFIYVNKPSADITPSSVADS